MSGLPLDAGANAVLPMFRLFLPLLMLVALPSSHAADATAEAEARATVAELGQLNGVALACREPELSGRAKRLMLDHVPKLRDWGKLYENATSQAFLAPPGGCPESALLRVRIELAAAKPTGPLN